MVHHRDQLLTIREALSELPRPVALCTIRRWYLNGVRGRRLKTVLQGGRRYTSRRWIDEFIVETEAVGLEANGKPSKEPKPLKPEPALQTQRGLFS